VPICCLGRNGEEEVRLYKGRFQAWEGLHARVMRELGACGVVKLNLSLVKQCHAALPKSASGAALRDQKGRREGSLATAHAAQRAAEPGGLPTV
jgi:hypothetical protein